MKMDVDALKAVKHAIKI